MFENKTLGEKEAKLPMFVFSMLRILENFNLNTLKNKLKASSDASRYMGEKAEGELDTGASNIIAKIM